MSEATLVLNAIETGNAKAADQLLPLVYNELRRLAASKMTNEAAGQTLRPTALWSKNDIVSPYRRTFSKGSETVVR